VKVEVKPQLQGLQWTDTERIATRKSREYVIIVEASEGNYIGFLFQQRHQNGLLRHFVFNQGKRRIHREQPTDHLPGSRFLRIRTKVLRDSAPGTARCDKCAPFTKAFHGLWSAARSPAGCSPRLSPMGTST